MVRKAGEARPGTCDDWSPEDIVSVHKHVTAQKGISWDDFVKPHNGRYNCRLVWRTGQGGDDEAHGYGSSKLQARAKAAVSMMSEHGLWTPELQSHWRERFAGVGETSGSQSGWKENRNDSRGAGETSGWQSRWNEGWSDGRRAGETSGWQSRWNDGRSDDRGSGETSGWQSR